MDIGVWMSGPVLEHKLEAASEKNPEQTWNMGRWPNGLSEKGPHRLFVASEGIWRGYYFKLSGEALYNPEDERAPYALLFDTRTWTEVPPTDVKRFRGFTYNVPSTGEPTKGRTGRLDHRHCQE
jgi:hypothetical protein